VKPPSTSEALFSLKSFIAAMLALYIAMRIGLPRPFWALMTVPRGHGVPTLRPAKETSG
jgi:uncharacterized membrane protein YccC